jgi:hypothetical protein
MSTTDRPPGDGKKRSGQSEAGSSSAQERTDRLAQQLRANLAKRKQQQRKRDAGPPTGKGG